MSSDPTQCYEVLTACFGPYQHGSVIPGFVVTTGGHDAAKLVAAGALAPTARAANVSILPPEPKAAGDDGTAELFAERNRLREELERATREAKLSAMKAAELEQSVKARDQALAAQLDQIGHLKTACETHQQALDAAETRRGELEAHVARLTADLEQATRPPEAAKSKSNKPAA